MTQKQRQELVINNKGLAEAIAAKFSKRNTDISWLDLLQEANLGLVESAQEYRAGRGVKFSSYAYTRIRRRVVEFISRQTLLTIGSAPHRRSAKFGNANKYPEKTEQLQAAVSKPFPLNENINNSIPDCLEGLIKADLLDKLETSIYSFTGMRRRVMILILAGLTINEASAELNIPNQKTQKIYKESLIALRELLLDHEA